MVLSKQKGPESMNLQLPKSVTTQDTFHKGVTFQNSLSWQSPVPVVPLKTNNTKTLILSIYKINLNNFIKVDWIFP